MAVFFQEKMAELPKDKSMAGSVIFFTVSNRLLLFPLVYGEGSYLSPHLRKAIGSPKKNRCGRIFLEQVRKQKRVGGGELWKGRKMVVKPQGLRPACGRSSKTPPPNDSLFGMLWFFLGR